MKNLMKNVRNIIVSVLAVLLLVWVAHTYAPESTAQIKNQVTQFADEAMTNFASSLGHDTSKMPKLSETFKNATSKAAKSFEEGGNFLQISSNGEPVKWNTCEPIHYIVNNSSNDPTALKDVKKAFNKINKMTGLNFTYDGETKEIPTTKWGAKSEPIIVAWAHDTETDILEEGDNARAAGYYDDKTASWISGYIVLNKKVENDFKPGFSEGMSRGNLLMHEIGHVVGLTHDDTSGENLMHTYIKEKTSKGFTEEEKEMLKFMGSPCKRNK